MYICCSAVLILNSCIGFQQEAAVIRIKGPKQTSLLVTSTMELCRKIVLALFALISIKF